MEHPRPAHPTLARFANPTTLPQATTPAPSGEGAVTLLVGYYPKPEGKVLCLVLRHPALKTRVTFLTDFATPREAVNNYLAERAPIFRDREVRLFCTKCLYKRLASLRHSPDRSIQVAAHRGECALAQGYALDWFHALRPLRALLQAELLVRCRRPRIARKGLDTGADPAAFPRHVKVFCDASRRTHAAGIAAVVFDKGDDVMPSVAHRRASRISINELEYRALFLGAVQALSSSTDQPVALFSDSQYAVQRFNQAIQASKGPEQFLAELASDAATPLPPPAQLSRCEAHWVRGHATCLGNHLADHYAYLAAE